MGRDTAPHRDSNQAPEVITIDDDSTPNHSPISKSVATVPRPEMHKDTERLHDTKAKILSKHASRDHKIFIIQDVSHVTKIHAEVVATHWQGDGSEQKSYDGLLEAAIRTSANTLADALCSNGRPRSCSPDST